MFNTNTQRRARKGQFKPTDREHPTTEQRKEYRQAEAELMRRNTEAMRPFEIHGKAPSYGELAAREGAKAIAAIHRGNAMMARDYARSAATLAMMEVGR
jgi:hypothetical protein